MTWSNFAYTTFCGKGQKCRSSDAELCTVNIQGSMSLRLKKNANGSWILGHWTTCTMYLICGHSTECPIMWGCFTFCPTGGSSHFRSGSTVVHQTIRDFPYYATFREKGAKLACADKLGVFLSLTLCKKASFGYLAFIK